MSKLLPSGFLAIAITLGPVAPPAAAQGSIAGDWDVSLESPLGAQSLTLSLKQPQSR